MFINSLAPTFAKACPNERVHRGYHLRAFWVRVAIHCHLDSLNNEFSVHGNANPHIVKSLSWLPSFATGSEGLELEVP
jgi:hypothetical protein